MVIMGITLVGATTYAFESESIKAENTFGFYENEFDFMLMPAKLAGQDSTLGEGHKLVEGFTGYRLFTNLTNQAGEDVYEIGGIIPVPGGLGNLGILFDYRDNDPKETAAELYEETWNLYTGYGLSIPGTPISVGVSYSYGSVDGNVDRDTEYSFFEELGEIEETKYDSETHEVALEGRFNQAPIDSLLGVSWKSTDDEVEVNGTIDIEGDAWSIYNENIFELNPTVALGLDLSYRWDDVDIDDYDIEIETEEFSTRAEVRLTFPKVRFGLGVSYDFYNEEEDDSEFELDQETWGAPVATEFNITDRLVGRLGAKFVYVNTELDIEETEEKRTSSDAIYNVGLGYQVTENLTVDAVWRHADWCEGYEGGHDEHAPIQREAAESDTVFVGATLAF
jgi:opacity protein-like surface antigen